MKEQEKKPITFQYIGALLDKQTDLYNNFWNSTGGGPVLLNDMIKQSAAFIDCLADVFSKRQPAANLFPFFAAMIFQYSIFVYKTESIELLKDQLVDRISTIRTQIAKMMKEMKDKMVKNAKQKRVQQVNKFNRNKEVSK